MFVFAKRSEIVLECFTARQDVFQYFPIANTGKHLPDWWKDLPRPVENLPTTQTNMRRCAGFVDLFRQGFVVPLWSDLGFTVGDNKQLTWGYADSIANVDFHSVEQRGGFAPQAQYTNAKITPPWYVRSNSAVEWLFSAPTYNQASLTDYVVCPGVANFKYQFSVNVNIFIPNEVPRTFVIPHGRPLVQLVPLTERKIKLKTHLVTDDEFLRLKTKVVRVSFVGAYDALKKVMQKAGE